MNLNTLIFLVIAKFACCHGNWQPGILVICFIPNDTCTKYELKNLLHSRVIRQFSNCHGNSDPKEPGRPFMHTITKNIYLNIT